MGLTTLKESEIYQIKALLDAGRHPEVFLFSHRRKFTEEMQGWVEANKRDPSFCLSTSAEILSKMRSALSLPEDCISLKSFQKRLHDTCMLSYKRASYAKPNMENEETRFQRKLFVFEMIPALLQGFIPIFIDETGISLDLKRERAWIPREKSSCWRLAQDPDTLHS